MSQPEDDEFRKRETFSVLNIPSLHIFNILKLIKTNVDGFNIAIARYQKFNYFKSIRL